MDAGLELLERISDRIAEQDMEPFDRGHAYYLLTKCVVAIHLETENPWDMPPELQILILDADLLGLGHIPTRR